MEQQNKVENKPKWWKPAIKGGAGGCWCCGSSEILSLDTRLYYGFGGWTIYKNGEEFFRDDRDVEFDRYKKLSYVEKLIGNDSENEYTAFYYGSLRDATYQRHAKNTWVLINKGQGFA